MGLLNDTIINELKNMKQNYLPAMAGTDNYNCPCSGNCGNTCSDDCVHSCIGDCTGSCDNDCSGTDTGRY